MRTVLLSAAAACAFASTASAQPPTSQAAPSPSASAVQKASPAMVARMQVLREAYAARTAVYDRTEQAFRAPTDAERAALSASAPAATAPSGVDLTRGGRGLRGASGELSFLVVEAQPDGSTIVRHADALPQRPAFARPIQLTPAAKPATAPSQEVRHAE